jgi:hypothetical protein
MKLGRLIWVFVSFLAVGDDACTRGPTAGGQYDFGIVLPNAQLSNEFRYQNNTKGKETIIGVRV